MFQPNSKSVEVSRFFKLCVGIFSATSSILVIILVYGSLPQRLTYDPDWRPPDLTFFTQSQNRNIHLNITLLHNGKEFTNKLTDLVNKTNSCGYIKQVKLVTRPALLNDVWHIYQGEPGQILIFGAYFDSRQNIHKETVRVLAVSTSKLTQDVFCQLWYANQTRPMLLKARVIDTGRGYGFGGKKYQERLYNCEIATRLVIPPLIVSLTFSKCQNSSISVPVQRPSPKHEHDFGICVVVAYGSLDPIALVEWIEYHRLIGIGEINVYDSHLNQKAKDVFKHYQTLGAVNIYNSAPPMNNWCQWCQKLAVIPALNDCMYRNMFRYKHMIVIDFDEFIVPKVALNLPSLMTKLRNTWHEEPASYMFRNAYFFKNFPTDSSQPNYPMTNRYLTRTEISKQGYAAKSIVNPRRCIIMQNHYCMIRTPDVSSRYALYVNPDLALSQHYKSCHLSKFECDIHLKHSIIDNSILRFMKPLNGSVLVKLRQLKLL